MKNTNLLRGKHSLRFVFDFKYSIIFSYKANFVLLQLKTNNTVMRSEIYEHYYFILWQCFTVYKDLSIDNSNYNMGRIAVTYRLWKNSRCDNTSSARCKYCWVYLLLRWVSIGARAHSSWSFIDYWTHLNNLLNTTNQINPKLIDFL